MLGRREFLIGGLGAGLAIPALSRLVGTQDEVDPRSYGGRGDGVADDTPAVRKAIDAALASGRSVNGGDAVFAVRGNVVISGQTGPWIRALRLRQLSPADDRRTLHFLRCERIRIDSLRVDLGRSKSIGYFNQSAGLWIDGGSGHEVGNVEAFGDGKNSLITIFNTAASKYSNLHAHSAEYDDPRATDDLIQGIYLCRNTDCVVHAPVVSNLFGNASRRFPTRYTRGIAGCGNTNLTIADARVSNVDQAIDLTGGDGNRRCSVVRAHCFQCNVGVKLANSAVGCSVVDSVAERCGLMGFLASGPAAPGLRFKTEDCDFIRCTALDIGYNGFSDSAPHAGFRVERNRFDRQYPMGIRLIDCRAIDRQVVKTMEFGFYADVEPVADKPNRLIDCESRGHIRGVRAGPWRLDSRPG